MLCDQVNPDGTPWHGCEGAELTPIDESLCYSATGFHLAHDYIIDLVAALNKQGLEVEHYHPELEHGQQAGVLIPLLVIPGPEVDMPLVFRGEG
jgi:glutamine synthetase